MAEKLEDLNLPNRTVHNIIKEVIPDNINVGKDARSALSRAASVFILYITSAASREAQKVNRKTLLGQDVLAALEELEFEDFIEPLQQMLQEFKDAKKKTVARAEKVNQGETEDTEEGDDDLIEENASE